jgi:hypothetical protein
LDKNKALAKSTKQYVSQMPVGQMSVGQMPVSQMSVSQMSVSQRSIGQMSVSQMSVGQMVFDPKTLNHWWQVRLAREPDSNTISTEKTTSCL